MSTAWQVPQLTSDRVLQQLLKSSRRRQVENVSPKRPDTLLKIAIFIRGGERHS
jgi:hypothetical protein